MVHRIGQVVSIKKHDWPDKCFFVSGESFLDGRVRNYEHMKAWRCAGFLRDNGLVPPRDMEARCHYVTHVHVTARR